MRCLSFLGLCLAACGVLCCGPHAQVAAPTNQAVSEKVLAARKLQEPLEKHLCRAAVYPSSEAQWRVTRVPGLSGRGKSFAAALEALCREADGLRLPAVSDITYVRMPGGWSDSHELHGVGLRYEEGFVPPPPPRFDSVAPPEMPQAGVEPPPSGERP